MVAGIATARVVALVQDEQAIWYRAMLGNPCQPMGEPFASAMAEHAVAASVQPTLPFPALVLLPCGDQAAALAIVGAMGTSSASRPLKLSAATGARCALRPAGHCSVR